MAMARARSTARSRSAESVAARPPSPTALAERLDDPDEPLYTMAVACELLATDAQTVRRLDELRLRRPVRSGGNQRRYSRNDLYVLAAALELLRRGTPRAAVAQLLAPDDSLDVLRRELEDHVRSERPVRGRR